MPPEQVEAFSEKIRTALPIGRFGRLEEAAEAAVFLASGGSSFMLGGEIAVDGGMAQI